MATVERAGGKSSESMAFHEVDILRIHHMMYTIAVHENEQSVYIYI